jgi:hypothetical protein
MNHYFLLTRCNRLLRRELTATRPIKILLSLWKANARCHVQNVSPLYSTLSPDTMITNDINTLHNMNLTSSPRCTNCVIHWVLHIKFYMYLLSPLSVCISPKQCFKSRTISNLFFKLFISNHNYIRFYKLIYCDSVWRGVAYPKISSH